MADIERQKSIWLEVANIRLVGKCVEIQVKGDRADREPVWWEVDLVKAGFGEPGKSDHNAANRAIAEGLDKKRIVLANLASVWPETEAQQPPATPPKTEAKQPSADSPEPGDMLTLKCISIRIQYAESNSR